MIWSVLDYTSTYVSTSSIGTTAHCRLWPVEQCPSIFSYLPQTLSIFSLPALDDPFLLPLSVFSWVFPFFSSLPVLEWRSFWASYPPPFSPGDVTSLYIAHLSILLYFFPLSISSSSRFVRLFYSPFSYLGPHILLKIFLSKISRACSSFFINVHASAPYDTTAKCKYIGAKLHNRHWYDHVTKSVESSHEVRVTILWNQQVRTDRAIPNNKPDITIRDNKQGTCMLIDVAIPGDRNVINVIKKEAEMILKYKDFIIEIQRMWNVKAKRYR